jgi:hypothetical protein
MQPHEFRRFANALTDPHAPLPADFAVPQGANLAQRFAVYRNNVASGLIDALAERFPFTRAVVGDDFFRAMARHFVRQSRPTGEVLHEYGDALPAFISGFEPAVSLPWLADLARLEMLWSQSWGAADAPAMSLGSLGDIGPDALLAARVVVHPAVRLLRSSAPIASLWQAHQQADPDLSTIPWLPQDVLVTRPQAEVQVTLLAPGVACFALELMHGATIEVAAGQAMSETQVFEIGPALAGLINNGFAMELAPCN